MRALARPKSGGAGPVPAGLAPSDWPTEIVAVTADSRAAAPGVMFAALPGLRQDGRDFIADAVARGAAAVLAPEGTPWPDGVPARPFILDPAPRHALARIAVTLAGPAPEVLVAVTGTNGKTSTVEFLRQIWAAQGLAAASLGTLGLIAPGFPQGSGLTTPDPVSLAGTLARLASAGIGHAALEASSHGLDQFRLDGITPAAAGFTNLTRDHLDYHGGIGAYRAAKLRLFGELLPQGAPAIAADTLDPPTLAALTRIAARRRLRFGTVGAHGSAIRLLSTVPRPAGQRLRFALHGTTHEVELALPGRFQADNVLMAAALAVALGARDVAAVLDRLTGVRGRLELAARLANGAAVYVDYAHTPDALTRLLEALRPHTEGRLVVLFGAGGDRDRGKRPLMGRAAARLADRVIVTDDNPRSEDPAAIRAEVRAGCPEAVEIGDRTQAIAAGLAGLGPGDVLAVAGKGHEQGQTIGTTVIPFDDAGTVRRLAGLA